MLYTRGHAHHLRRNKTPPSSAVNHAMSMTWAWREINNCETEITGNMRGTEGAAVKGRMPYKRTDNLFSIPVYVGDARVLVRHWHQDKSRCSLDREHSASCYRCGHIVCLYSCVASQIIWSYDPTRVSNNGLSYVRELSMDNYKVVKKVIHHQKSSLNRIKTAPVRLHFSSILSIKWAQKCHKFVLNILWVT